MEGTMNNDFEWRVQKVDCMQKIDVIYIEGDRMSGKFVQAIEQEQLLDMEKIAKLGKLEDHHFVTMDRFAAKDFDQGSYERTVIEKLMKIYDHHQRSVLKEAKTALDEAREATTRLNDEPNADRVGHLIVEKYTEMKRKYPPSSSSNEPRKRSRSVGKGDGKMS